MDQIVIVSDDRPGILANISHILGKDGININGVNASIVERRAIITLLVKNKERAIALLQQNGYNVLTRRMIAVRLMDVPGEQAKFTQLLADRSINMEDMHMVAREKGSVIYAIKVDKYDEAKEVLKGYLLHDQDNIYE